MEASSKLCEKIEKIALEEKDWCFRWIAELKEWEKTSNFADRNHQIHLMPKHSDDEVVLI